MSRALRDTELSRRIALVFVGAFGRTSLGVSYSLVMSDVTLAAGIPSIIARSGGIVLPIARSIAASLANMAIWLTIGFAWWKFLGFGKRNTVAR